MTQNWYRRLLFVGVGVWIGGVLAVLFGTGAVVLDLGPWWAGVATGFLSGRSAVSPAVVRPTTGRCTSASMANWA